jgi:hypothetical protein
MSRLIQRGAGQFIAAPADAALDIGLARLVAPRRQAEVRTRTATVGCC